MRLRGAFLPGNSALTCAAVMRCRRLKNSNTMKVVTSALPSMPKNVSGVLMPLSRAEKSVVLVVEETAVFRSATAERLRAAGFEVSEAAKSFEPEQVLKSTAVDALISHMYAPAN